MPEATAEKGGKSVNCSTCKHFKVRRGLWGLLGLCFQHWQLYHGLMRRGHAPYKLACCRCEFWEAKP